MNYTILDGLVPTPQAFYLTGSRAMGFPTPESDWDYFTQDTEEIREWLVDRGFTLVACPSYLDTVAVYRRGGLMNIDVQLVDDVEVKLVAQSRLKKLFLPASYLRDKVLMRYFWRLALVRA